MENLNIGIICPGDFGHIFPALAIAIELRKRGYNVFFYQNEDGKMEIEKYGFKCSVYGAKYFPSGAWKEFQRTLGKKQGLRAVTYTERINKKRVRAGLEDLPALFEADAINFMIIDQVTFEAAAVAEYLHIPYITLSSSLPLNCDFSIPPFYTSLLPGLSKLNKLTCWLFNRLLKRGITRNLKPVNRFRKDKGLKLDKPEAIGVSTLGQLCQLSEKFDFPRLNNTNPLYFCGWIFDQSVINVQFPYDKLGTLPLVYCSFGTIQTGNKARYMAVIEACRELEVQLVISLGGNTDIDITDDIPSNTIICRYVPQHELLSRASLFISHCGLGGVMQSLYYGTPILAMPITNDQPGVAARVEWCGAGKILKSIDSVKIKKYINEILSVGSYKSAALQQSFELNHFNGAKVAVDIIENIIRR